MQKFLSICIPTIIGREEKFNKLYDFISRQISNNNLDSKIEIIFIKDDKQMSIGNKRQEMYSFCKAKYAVQIDDDDWVSDDYVLKVVNACDENYDCIGYKESVTIDGVDKGDSLFSIGFPDWIEKYNVKGCVRVRTPFFKTPIKTELCLKIGVKDMRWGEDHDFAKRILPHLKTQTFIDEVMYKYGFVSEGNYWKRFGMKTQNG